MTANESTVLSADEELRRLERELAAERKISEQTAHELKSAVAINGVLQAKLDAVTRERDNLLSEMWR
jgi:hypothetical protein